MSKLADQEWPVFLEKIIPYDGLHRGFCYFKIKPTVARKAGLLPLLEAEKRQVWANQRQRKTRQAGKYHPTDEVAENAGFFRGIRASRSAFLPSRFFCAFLPKTAGRKP